ncbi:hypothetical protein COLO4_33717 [Corchorus olitorius]|uniref:Uncharacterized protein n=1 Tax=Corchorus olitorius TaxID=93759 RepID=A0A1R3GS11_9ROSI|nr:hypothetical protein COLO4_33717 [Corchorus olitorius]
MEAKQPSCNSRWSQDDGGERPFEIALTGKMSKRCGVPALMKINLASQDWRSIMGVIILPRDAEFRS